MTYAPNNPPLGYCVPLRYLRVRDGDTAEFRTRIGNRIAIRLIGVDAPESDEVGYEAESQRVAAILADAEEIKLFIPLPDAGKDGILDVIDILRQTTFDRVPGHLYADGDLVL